MQVSKQACWLTLACLHPQVYPYYAVSYNPWPFQPPVSAANSSGYASCLGFEAEPQLYVSPWRFAVRLGQTHHEYNSAGCIADPAHCCKR